MSDEDVVFAILQAALDQDRADGGRFDAIGFDQFCPEEKPKHVREAWKLYCIYHQARP